MENNESVNNLQVSSRDLLLFRLRKIRRNQRWLAKELSVNSAYVSQFFTVGHYSYLEEKIERRIAKEEVKRNQTQAA